MALLHFEPFIRQTGSFDSTELYVPISIKPKLIKTLVYLEDVVTVKDSGYLKITSKAVGNDARVSFVAAVVGMHLMTFDEYLVKILRQPVEEHLKQINELVSRMTSGFSKKANEVALTEFEEVALRWIYMRLEVDVRWKKADYKAFSADNVTKLLLQTQHCLQSLEYTSPEKTILSADELKRRVGVVEGHINTLKDIVKSYVKYQERSVVLLAELDEASEKLLQDFSSAKPGTNAFAGLADSLETYFESIRNFKNEYQSLKELADVYSQEAQKAALEASLLAPRVG